jgi:amiloride-sensitive sodium channel
MSDGNELFKSNFFGINGGLSVIGTGRPQPSDGHSGAIYSEGFVVIVHHPNDFAVESAPATYIELNKETFIDIQPIHSYCTDQVLALAFEQRKCIIPTDVDSDMYRQPECMLSCVRDRIHAQCSCHPFHLPKGSNQSSTLKDCKAPDVNCFTEHYCENNKILITVIIGHLIFSRVQANRVRPLLSIVHRCCLQDQLV